MPYVHPAVILCPLLGVLSPFLFCDTLRNNHKKKKLIEQYAEQGVEVPGAVLHAETTTYRSSLGYVRRRTHKITYCYGMETGDLCVKPETEVSVLPTSRRIRVVVLPGFEKSGIPKSVLDNRNSTYDSCKWAMRSIFLLVIHVLGLIVLMAIIFCWSDDDCGTNTPVYPALVGTSVVLNIAGYFAANSFFANWKNNLLHGSSQIIRGSGYSRVNSDVPTAEILSILNESDDPEAGDAVQARAVPTLGTDDSSQVAVVAEASLVQDHLSWYNPQLHDERANKVRQAVQDSDWMCLRDLFAELRGKHIERSFYMGVIDDVLEEQWKTKSDLFSPVLDDWAKAESDNPDCCLVRGSCYIRWAWDARGSGCAVTVGEDAWPKFFSRIDQAMAELERTSELDPSDALAYANRVTVFMAKKGRDEAGVGKVVTQLAKSDDPNNLLGHERLLQFYCRKWGGSDEEMFGFARKATKDLPEGHPLWILIVQAHYEAYMGLVSLAQATQHQITHQIAHQIAIAAAVSYWKQPTIKQEILHSYQNYIGSARREPTTTTAEESVLMKARNWYAYCLAQTGNMDMARRELLLIGRHPTQRPWGSLDRYQKACNEAGVSL